MGTSERREINTDEHGKFVDPTSEKTVRNLVTQQKSSRAVAENKDVRTNFKSVVLWDDRDRRVYKEDSFAGMRGWYLWISHDGKDTVVASIYVFKNLEQRSAC